jgi:DNA-directed RNA polymerase specialized sigma24 family protein
VSDGVRPLEDRNSARVFDEHRDLLISVAYRVLGSVTDAEDTVQEAWLRWFKVDPAEV